MGSSGCCSTALSRELLPWAWGTLGTFGTDLGERKSLLNMGGMAQGAVGRDNQYRGRFWGQGWFKPSLAGTEMKVKGLCWLCRDEFP